MKKQSETQTGTADDLKSRVDRCYQAETVDQLRNVYDDWAGLYEADLVTELGWDGPRQSGSFLMRHAAPTDRILDVAAGTGLGGLFLKENGYGNVDALDMSENMLSQARKKNVYQNYYVMRLGGPLDIPTATFDALIAVGVFTAGHAGPECLDELLRITRPGGVFVFSIRPDVERDMGFRVKMDELEAAGRWQCVEVSDHLQGFRDVQTSPYRVFVYRVI